MSISWTEAYAPQWVPEYRYAPNEDRQVLRALRRQPGIVSPDDFRVTATEPASMRLRVARGRAVIDGSIDELQQGSYCVAGPDDALLDLPVSDPDRVTMHLVVAHVEDEDFGGSGYGWARHIVPGNPGQGVPPLPENALLLATVTVGAGWNSVGQGSIIDERGLVNPLLTVRSSTHVLAPPGSDMVLPRTENILLQAPNATGMTNDLGALTIAYPSPFPRAVAALTASETGSPDLLITPFDIRLNLFQVVAWRPYGAPGGPAGRAANTIITVSYLAVGW
jgi:hypothetical protein